MKIIGIIPARFGSTRFPGKPLSIIQGKSMIQRVFEQCKKSELNDVIVATDDQRIYDHVISFKGKVVMTSDQHVSGTDRCLEAMQKQATPPDAVINVQGDEPFIDPNQINQLINILSKPEVNLATLAVHIGDSKWIHDPNKVKVVCDKNQKAVYFSRAPIPFQKQGDPTTWNKKFRYLKHVGIYGYKTDVLKMICALPPSPLELAESLEQLRWIENGYSIYIGETDRESPSIDTPEDLVALLLSIDSKGKQF